MGRVEGQKNKQKPQHSLLEQIEGHCSQNSENQFTVKVISAVLGYIYLMKIAGIMDACE